MIPRHLCRGEFILRNRVKNIIQDQRSLIKDAYRKILDTINVKEQTELLEAFKTILRLM